MKYIRLNDYIAECTIELDGIYYCSTQHNPQLKNKGYITIYNCQINKGDSTIITGDFYCIYKNQIIKEANTIKELCDGYAFICDDFTKPQWVIPMNFDYCKTHFKHTEIYGGIGTHKGFIYVAKMNEEEELELL